MVDMDVYSGFNAYKVYIALRNHFTTDSYDFFKYNGKTRVRKETYLKRKDRFFFTKLERKYDHDELANFFVSNFINEANWIGNLVGQQAEYVYVKWMNRIDFLFHNFEIDLQFLKSTGTAFDDILKSESGQHPLLLKHYLSGQVCLETLTILNSVVDFASKWETRASNVDLVWREKSRVIKKYRPFLKFDKPKFAKVVINEFS